MKKNHFEKSALTRFVCLCLGVICCLATSYAAPKKSDAAAQSSDGGTLVVSRNPSVGSGIFVSISVDGKQVTTLSQGRRYQGALSPGKHVISLIPDPNLGGQRPNKVEITVEQGHTYSFSA